MPQRRRHSVACADLQLVVSWEVDRLTLCAHATASEAALQRLHGYGWAVLGSCLLMQLLASALLVPCL